ncbi:CubicO group peptidase, beta-lactamase class C family [Roseovarius nanhaiticus]|uniref:CubicO group peptidase, beta-lactamase class C family n=1 Tax=Roseovarius nanhaiticus TaxID=573024 RepID=A0A1N7FSK1_9RHOB|nr:serine hydrolase [Roseovarius nanhaiticus]SEK46596.1 CubicO group peptidase, beta-lactamase class C family [Roseovarius nanhaiticus]SIS03300.1 CubicO group peptidase, beta-lactamase class C family [Roseovarius nanhaiticus]
MTLTRRQTIAGATAALAVPAGTAGDARAQASEPGDFEAMAGDLDQLHALVIHRGSAPVFERAFAGRGLDAPANVKSVSKTLLALLTGIGIARGALPGPDARVLPALGRAATGDVRDEITIGDLLSMRAGLASTSGAEYGAWVASPNWVDHVLGRDLVAEPGGRFIYSTGGWHLLGAALARGAGRDLHSLAQRWLGDPLDIEIAPWQRDPQGNYMGGNQMALSPRALARIGDMVLAEGRWNGDQVVPADWIATSLEPRGRSQWSGDRYGYGWFLTRLDGHAAAYGRGYGGQILAVVPDLDLTIAITSDPTLPARSEGHFGELRRLMGRIAASAAQGDL